MRTCKYCLITKDLAFFVQKNAKSTWQCKDCKKKYDIEYRQKNIDKIKQRYYNISQTEEFKKKNRLRIKEWRQDNPQKYKEAKARRREIETEWMKKFYKKKQDDINWVLKDRLRKRLSSAIRTKKSKFSEYIGCSIGYLKEYLESKFVSGMTWENYGQNGWHIDHIRPLSSFDLTKKEELLKACHYTNLQPLWAEENLKKGAKYE